MAYGTYDCPVDDEITPPGERDIPSVPGLNYTCAFSSTTAAVFRLPLNVKVCTLTNNTDQTLNVFVSKFTGVKVPRPSAGSSRIIAIAAGAMYPFASIDQFNEFDIACTAATGSIRLEPGSGPVNNLADPEIRALVAVV